MSSLDRLKLIVERHLKRELDILEKILELTDEGTKELYRLYPILS